MFTETKPTVSLESGLPTVGSIVWTAGRNRAQQAINLYANLDYLRPYFDVEPKEVLQNLLQSLVPRRSSSEQAVKPELYGPSMIVFTLAAILIYQMKLSSHSVQDGTLIGTSFLVCFGYWIGGSMAISSLSFICNARLSLMQILSVNGYAMFSHCIVLVVATFIHTDYDHLLFYSLWLVVGGIGALRMSILIMSRSVHRRHRLTFGLLIIAIHLGFLLYLHFAYHQFAETVAHAFKEQEEANLKAELVKQIPTVIESSSTVVTKVIKRAIRDQTQQLVNNSTNPI